MNSYPNLDEKNVYVFSAGESMNINSIEVSSIIGLSTSFNINQQLDHLLEVINNLGKTVNRNAFFMKNLSDKVKDNEENSSNNVLFGTYLTNNNAILNNFIQSKGMEELKTPTLMNVLNRVTPSQEKLGNAKSKFTREDIKSLIETNSSLTSKFVKESFDTRKAQEDLWEKINYLESKIASLENLLTLPNELNDLRVELNTQEQKTKSQMDDLQGKLEKISHSVDGQVKLIDDMEKRIKTEMKFLSQKVDESNKYVRSQTDLNKGSTPVSSKTELFAKYLEVESFRKFKDLNNEIIDGLEKKINEINMESIQTFVESRLNHFFKESKAKTASKVEEEEIVHHGYPSSTQTNLLETNQTNLMKQNQVTQERLTELEEKLNEIERTLNKKILNVDSRLKDIEDIKKLNKIVTRMQMELNLKVNKEVFESEINEKLSKNDFFDFVNENLITLDQLKTIQHDLTTFKEQTNQGLQNLENMIKGVKSNLSKSQENNESSFREHVGKVSDIQSIVGRLGDNLKDLLERFNFLSQRFQDTKAKVFSLINTRLNSLATTKPLSCLSCGAKDINYPPINEYVQGEKDVLYPKDLNVQPSDATVYMNGTKYKPLINSKYRAQEISSAKTNCQSIPTQAANGEAKDTTSNCGLMIDENVSTNYNSNTNNYKVNSISKSRIASNYISKSGKESQYTTGSQVFNTKHIVREHQEKLHLPVDIMIRNGSIAKNRLRPFSSIPQRPKNQGA